ncbi:N-acetylglutamate synthase, GNAT family [Actinopolymorpha cephalotaxi]|uniref:N-acetylglutamate synthase, GNAT family n=1 Tax=Actinopolymorpha cephalotaxi TaxID=504797 RepID=A0A1I2Z4L0_9ACTN|nr:GNAT family N-acetyltransferase [Actinopolymorpha cephalotaxi]NYH81860.1 ribosomal protein S18 acetylase RimI-like enzyme [Actinopolymorpha cephalotaxi]SFH32802.1 N-acetylglutamate synthase, GNAT family [Actinopolymorpha cephalotaxi]
MLVRDARPSEYAAVSRLLGEVYGGESLVHPHYLPALADTRRRAEDPATDVLVAVDAGRVVGTATLTLPGTRWTEVPPQEAMLRMLAVAPQARRGGVGTALIEECAVRARLAGETTVALTTTDSMVDAHRRYERLGFVRTPVRDWVTESGEPLRAYVRSLPPAPVVREARPEEYAAAGQVTLAAYQRDGLLGDADDYAEALLDTKRRAVEASLMVAVDEAADRAADGAVEGAVPRTGAAVLGTVTYCPAGSTYQELSGPGEGEFRMLAVAPPARGRGVGELLVRTMLARAHADGHHAVVLSTTTVGHRSHRLYERLGFGRVPDRDWRPVPGVTLLAYRREV